MAARFTNLILDLIVFSESIFAEVIQIVRRLLVYAVVEPVQEQQVSVASPTRNGRVIWVVVRVVIDRNCWLHPFTQIPNVLIVKSVRVILWMAGNKKRFACLWSLPDIRPPHRMWREYLSQYVLLKSVAKNRHNANGALKTYHQTHAK